MEGSPARSSPKRSAAVAADAARVATSISSMGGHAAAAAKRRRQQEAALEATDDNCLPHVTATSLTKYSCAFQRVVKAYTQGSELRDAAHVQLQALRAVIASDDANAADVVDFLISRVVCEVDNTNATPELGRPPLHLALERRGFPGQFHIVQALVAQPAPRPRVATPATAAASFPRRTSPTPSLKAYLISSQAVRASPQ